MTKIDVLAVMDELVAEARALEYAGMVQRGEEARAAVAELIEADKEHDEAIMAVHKEACGRTTVARTVAANQRRNDAILRRRAAVARIGGAA